MINNSKRNDSRYWDKWRASGAVGSMPGKAYGFFYCRAPREEIEAELPTLRECAQTPSQLELTLVEGLDNLKGDAKVRELAKEAKEQGIRYILEATSPGATNPTTANEVADLLYQMYQSPLYEAGEEFRGAVAYQENGEYVLRE